MSSKPDLTAILARLEALESLPVIVAARAQLEADRIARESAEREEALKAEKRAAELATLRGFLEQDPLVRITVTGGPGSHIRLELAFPGEKIDTGELALAAEGSGATAGRYLAQAWIGRSSDWARVVKAGGAAIERAVRDGVLAAHTYSTTDVIGDARLRDAWWRSKGRP